MKHEQLDKILIGSNSDFDSWDWAPGRADLLGDLVPDPLRSGLAVLQSLDPAVW